MVVLHNLQDIYLESARQVTLNLPTIKQNYLKIDYGNSDNKGTVYNGSEPLLPFAASRVIKAGIRNWKRLTADHEDCKAVYEVTFDVTGSNLNFRPGDTIGVIPRNLDTEVSLIINHLELSDVDCSYNITVNSQKGKIPAHIPVKSTLRYVLTYCVDLRSVMKKLFLLALSGYTKNETEKKVLEYICSKEGSTAYTNCILNKNICILDLFEIFKTCKPPVEVILEHLPRLLPRPYSIVNSCLLNPNEVKICFSVMDIGNNRKGLVTGWLESLIHKSLEDMMSNITITDKKYTTIDKVPIYLRKNVNQFSFPENMSKPMLLIGPGTGVAPYIGFLEEQMKEKKPNESIWLFFGCRNPDLDFIYKDKLQEFKDSGVLTKLITAFSRLENCEDKYIQDAIFSNGEEVAKLLKNGALVYVCGDVKTMAIKVKESLVKCLVNFNEFTQDEAEKFVYAMQKEKTYLIDSWN
ncbi:PREDICTED: methionine synthase reductase [Papilio polytes]|uniref:methionine synthase reductase n=1 Tax=Papilio polytes TaxID=76194 RepID=UPI000675CE5B|nr:PREDICTED: methionine synthase reductase [Papilio polytes]